MPEPDTPTAVSRDAIEHFVETRLLCQALQLGSEILLKRLAASLSPPLKRSVNIGWEITNEHVCHACIMISYRVPGQAVSRDEGEQTAMELTRVRIASGQLPIAIVLPARWECYAPIRAPSCTVVHGQVRSLYEHGCPPSEQLGRGPEAALG